MAKYNQDKLRKLISPEAMIDGFIDYDTEGEPRIFCELKLCPNGELDCLIGGIDRAKYENEYHPLIEPRGLPKAISGIVFDAVLKVSGSVIVKNRKNKLVWGGNAKDIFGPYDIKLANNVSCVSYFESSEVEQVIARYERLTGKSNAEILAIYNAMIALDAGTPGISRFIFWYR